PPSLRRDGGGPRVRCRGPRADTRCGGCETGCMTAAPVLSAHGLAWQAGGREVLGPLDLDVVAGECLMIVGPNGAGQTTLLRCLSGLLHPSAGELRHRGRSYAGLSRRELARQIAYVPQVRPAAVPLAVEEVVLLGRYPYLSALQLAPAARDFQAVEEALARVG